MIEEEDIHFKRRCCTYRLVWYEHQGTCYSVVCVNTIFEDEEVRK